MNVQTPIRYQAQTLHELNRNIQPNRTIAGIKGFFRMLNSNKAFRSS